MARQPRVRVDIDVDVRAAAAEGIATLLFVFLGVGTVVATGMLFDGGGLGSARLTAIALAHGLGILIGVVSIAKISGGHLNPAVTVAAFLTGKIGLRKAGTYIAAQLIGATLGTVLVAAVAPGAIDGALGSHSLGADVSALSGLLAEIVGTFALVWVIFAVAIDPKGPNNIAPIAIGLTVLVLHFALVPLTGASVNPARSFGPALISGEWADHWVYWLGPLVGGSLAGFTYQWFFMGHGNGGDR
ncbi:MAG: MIP family channel protein [Dehalococcoidia bacterium]|nr:MIP family channel protein [Dehalococcoidia bacterium]